MSESNAIKDVKEMMCDLDEYYKAAGFAGVYEKVLAKMDENKIRECYHDTFETEADHELEDWERCFKTEE